jgi:hypothetical protein
LLSPVPIDYDPSNGSWNVFTFELRIKNTGVWEVGDWAYPTLGHAMSGLKPQIQGEWEQEKPGGPWRQQLKADSAFSDKYVAVRITQLVMVLNEPLRPDVKPAKDGKPRS